MLTKSEEILDGLAEQIDDLIYEISHAIDAPLHMRAAERRSNMNAPSDVEGYVERSVWAALDKIVNRALSRATR